MSTKQAKTHTVKLADISHDWLIINAEGQTLGRLASQIAIRLMGKHKPTYSPHLDMGDNLVVINAAKLQISGTKTDDKHYYRHSGYPGGLKSASLRQVLERHPEQVLVQAVRGMLPKNRLNDDRLARLKVYAGPEHPHMGQKPRPLKGEL